MEDSEYRQIAEVKTGRYPVALSINPYTHTIYVVNRDDDTVSVIDGVTNSLVDTIRVGHIPLDISFSPYTGMAYVANDADNSVSIIDTSINNVTSTIALTEGITEDTRSGIGIT